MIRLSGNDRETDTTRVTILTVTDLVHPDH